VTWIETSLNTASVCLTYIVLLSNLFYEERKKALKISGCAFIIYMVTKRCLLKYKGCWCDTLLWTLNSHI